MLTLIALIIALLFLDSPWNVIIVVVAVVIDILEWVAYIWWTRRQRRRVPPAVGVEALVGRRGVAVERLVPGTREEIGQVRVDGEIWGARARETIESGSSVVVRAVDELVLEVDPAPPS
jgi:membrane protein implicated in regulation of membrane protease activity